MAKYRAQIIWEFDFDEKGITESEYEWRFSDEEELEGFSRSPEEMMRYAKEELYEYISNYDTNLWDAIDVVEVKDE